MHTQLPAVEEVGVYEIQLDGELNAGIAVGDGVFCLKRFGLDMHFYIFDFTLLCISFW